MKIQLIDRNLGMCEQWKLQFKNCKDVVVHHGDFFSLKTDCVVSPANSFGFMDGALDLAISKKIGWQVQEKLQKRIATSFYNGELLVGQAILIETENSEIPYCISAPTMRVPLILKDSVNVYLAAKAIFTLLIKVNSEAWVSNHEELIGTVTISGLGTGVGKMPYDICARQMKTAYDDFWMNKYSYPSTWFEAQKRHQLLYSNSYHDLQH